MVRRILLAVGLVLAYLIPTNTKFVSGQTAYEFSISAQSADVNYQENIRVYFARVSGSDANADFSGGLKIPAGGTISINDVFAPDSYMNLKYAGGIVGGGACNATSFLYYAAAMSGLSVSATDTTHDPVPGVPAGYWITVYATAPRRGAAEKDAWITNPGINPVEINWEVQGDVVRIWVQTQGEHLAPTPTPSSLLIPLGPEETTNANPTSWPFSLLTERFEFGKYLLPPGWVLGIVFLLLLVITLKAKKSWIIITALLTAAALMWMLTDEVAPPPVRQGMLIPFEQSSLIIPLNTGDSEWTTPTLALRTPVGENKLDPRWPDSIQQWGDWITEDGKTYDIDVDVMAAIGYGESFGGLQWIDDGNGNPKTTISSDGATGYLQIMPSDNPLGKQFRNQDGLEYFTWACNPGLDRDTVFRDGCRPYYSSLANNPKLVTNFGMWLLRVYINATGNLRDAVKAYGHQYAEDPYRYVRYIQGFLYQYVPEKAHLLNP